MTRFCIIMLIAVSLAGCGSMDQSVSDSGLRAGDAPYASKAKGKPGFVVSPYNNEALIDVRGMPRGTPVDDPWTGKIFLVP